MFETLDRATPVVGVNERVFGENAVDQPLDGVVVVAIAYWQVQTCGTDERREAGSHPGRNRPLL